MVKPLTKRQKDGLLYARRASVEAAIDLAQTQDLETLRSRLRITDCGADEYLQTEVLVHLMRDARRGMNAQLMDALFPALLKRCESNLLASVSDDGLATAGDVREEILGQFGEMFAEDGLGDNSDKLDYFECSFNSAFRALRVDAVRKEIARLQHLQQLPDEREERSETDDEVLSRISKSYRTPGTQEVNQLGRRLWQRICALPREERRAVVLCHLLGYEVESEDPSRVTAETLCGVTGRTIRARLSRAAAKLAKFEQEG
jgi:DNA-directed RNA polymerase specialized sigma24 family protein